MHTICFRSEESSDCLCIVYACSHESLGKACVEASGPSSQSLSGFPWYEATRSIPPPLPPLDGMLAQRWDTPSLPSISSPVPIYTPGWREAPGPFDLESSALNIRPPLLPVFTLGLLIIDCKTVVFSLSR